MGEEGSMPLDEQMTVAQAREAALAFKDLEGEPQPVAKVEDHLIPSPRGELALGVRVDPPQGEPPFPLLVYFHGSGWTIANVEVADTPCRALANAAGAVVISVEYRLGPEHKFPAPLEDCNLAAAVTLMARERGGPKISQQVLLYPATNHSFDTPSYQENADGYMLTRESCRWFWANYLNSDEEGRNPYASPLQAEDLAGLPPAFIVTCEYDPLRDEGEAYGERLRAAGVPAKVSRYDGMIHGFLWMGGVLDRTRQLIEEVAAEVRAAPKPLPTVPV